MAPVGTNGNDDQEPDLQALWTSWGMRDDLESTDWTGQRPPPWLHQLLASQFSFLLPRVDSVLAQRGDDMAARIIGEVGELVSQLVQSHNHQATGMNRLTQQVQSLTRELEALRQLVATQQARPVKGGKAVKKALRKMTLDETLAAWADAQRGR